MSTDKKNGDAALTKAPASTLAAQADFSDLDFAAPAEAMKVGESFLYRPGDQKLPGIFSDEKDKQGRPVNGVQAGQPHCGWMPIQGWLVEEVLRVAKKDSGMKDYYQFVILLTKACPGISGDKIRRCEPGEMIVVKASGNMADFRRAAKNPSNIYEVWMKPTGEYTPMKDPNKQPMRAWDKRVVQYCERSLVKVPRIPELRDDDDFDPRVIEASAPEVRA